MARLILAAVISALSATGAQAGWTGLKVDDGAVFYGVALVPLSNGSSGISIGGSLGICFEEGRDPCEYLWHWTGSELALLPN